MELRATSLWREIVAEISSPLNLLMWKRSSEQATRRELSERRLHKYSEGEPSLTDAISS